MSEWEDDKKSALVVFELAKEYSLDELDEKYASLKKHLETLKQNVQNTDQNIELEEEKLKNHYEILKKKFFPDIDPGPNEIIIVDNDDEKKKCVFIKKFFIITGSMILIFIMVLFIYKHLKNKPQPEPDQNTDTTKKADLLIKQDTTVIVKPDTIQPKNKKALPIPQMIRVKGGDFVIGKNDAEATFTEHNITLSTFEISSTEITQELFNNIMGYNPSLENCLQCPVENIEWIEAVEFCNKLNKKLKLQQTYNSNHKRIFGTNGYRLPTEAEWEYAARACKEENIHFSGTGWFPEKGKTNAVKQFKPNELGIYDMSGNVAEWCYDWYGPYDPTLPILNPQGPEFSQKMLKVVRGGGFNDVKPDCKVITRDSHPLGEKSERIGFRIAKDIN